jgi:hypothetical protein
MEEPLQDRAHMTPREPVFTEIMQIGIVVRDLEATVRRYVDDYGIGPWEFAQIDAGGWSKILRWCLCYGLQGTSSLGVLW